MEPGSGIFSLTCTFWNYATDSRDNCLFFSTYNVLCKHIRPVDQYMISPTSGAQSVCFHLLCLIYIFRQKDIRCCSNNRYLWVKGAGTTSTRCWPYAGPASQTLAQHEASIGLTLVICWEPCWPSANHRNNLFSSSTSASESQLSATECWINGGPTSDMPAHHGVIVAQTIRRVCWRIPLIPAIPEVGQWYVWKLIPFSLKNLCCMCAMIYI